MSAQVLVRLSDVLAARLDREATRSGLTRPELIRSLLDQHLPTSPAVQLDGQLTIGDDAP